MSRALKTIGISPRIRREESRDRYRPFPHNPFNNILFCAQRFTEANASDREALRGRLIYELLLRRNVKRFRGGLVFKAHRHVYHSTLGLRVIKMRRRRGDAFPSKQARNGEGFRGSVQVKLSGSSPPPDTTLPIVVYSSPIGCTSCIVKSVSSRSSFMSSPVWTP